MNAEVAAKAREKFSSWIEAGKEKAAESLNSMQREFSVRHDTLVVPNDIDHSLISQPSRAVHINKGRLPLRFRDRDRGIVTVETTPHSMSQYLGRIGMPSKFASELSGVGQPWSMELLARNMNDLASNNTAGRILVREVDGVAKGILSDKYKRMDTSPVVEQFLVAAMAEGMVPGDGMNTESRFHVKAFLPTIYEPVPNEVMVFFASLTASDYGMGALQVSSGVMRVWCANMAVGESMFRQVHLGRRFDGDASMWSSRTHSLDSKTVASAVRDVIGDGRFRTEVDKSVKLIKAASEVEPDVRKVLAGLSKSGRITKFESETAENIYSSELSTESLPQKKSAWRLSNVLSLMAQSKAGDKALDFQTAAHEVMVAVAG